MSLLILIVLLILIFGAPIGSYQGWYGPRYGWGGSGVLLIILIIILLLYRPW
jgi:hypothetical protein